MICQKNDDIKLVPPPTTRTTPTALGPYGFAAGKKRYSVELNCFRGNCFRSPFLSLWNAFNLHVFPENSIRLKYERVQIPRIEKYVQCISAVRDERESTGCSSSYFCFHRVKTREEMRKEKRNFRFLSLLLRRVRFRQDITFHLLGLPSPVLPDLAQLRENGAFGTPSRAF